ncbi:ATP-binding protein [bacterium]|nr:ATP-binding protein [bacterium]
MEKSLIPNIKTFDVLDMPESDTKPQLYSLIYGREVLSDVAGTYYSFLKIPRTAEFAETVQTLFEEAKHSFSFELFARRQVVEYGITCSPRDREQMMSSFHLVFPSSRIQQREDYTKDIPEDAVLLASDFGSLCSHAMPYLTFRQLMVDSLSPMVNLLTLLPPTQQCVIQFVLKPYPDTPLRNFHMRLSMYHWLSVFIRNPYQWFWPGTYERHLWGNARMKEHLFHANLRILLWEENRHHGDKDIESQQREALELSMQAIHCPLRLLDMHALGICARKKTKFDRSALVPFQERRLSKPFVLTSNEVASFYHPVPIRQHPHVKHFLSAIGTPPAGVVQTGQRTDLSVFGVNSVQGIEQKFGIARASRLGQLHVLGKSGSGKSKLVELLMRDDLVRGKGIALIDCHGDLTEEVLAAIPESRLSDVCLLDFADASCLQAFNPFSLTRGETRKVLINTLVQFLCADIGRGIPTEREQKLLKNLLLVVTSLPGTTISELLQVLLDPILREEIITKSLETEAKEYFSRNKAQLDELLKQEFFLRLRAELSMLLATNYVSDVMQQEENAYDFPQIVRDKKIFIARLPKQMLGTKNTSLLGSLLLALIDSAAEFYAGQKSMAEPFYVYIDEFQNFASNSFVSQLSSAKEKGLSYTIVHQTLGQIPKEIQTIIKSKIENFIAFQLGGSDATFMSEIFREEFTANHLMHLDFRHFYALMTMSGDSVKPFSGRTIDVDRVAKGDDVREKVRERMTADSQHRFNAGGKP